MAPKSIFRQPGVQHFQLVHRSQQDPLIHDPEASQHVLKAFERGNVTKGKSRIELEQLVAPSDLERPNLGEASAYGVYFDDTEYDYMQHLRPVGLQEDGVDSVLIEASAKPNAKGKGKAKDPITLLLPPEALPSAEVPRNHESEQAVPSSISGFQPDMDPHLRQVLEALEDDAFVDDGLEDGFFGELVAAGERDSDENVEFEFDENGADEEEGEGLAKGLIDPEGGDLSWETRFAQFKKAQKAQGGADVPVDTSDLDEYSDGGDTIGSLPQFSVIGGKRRRKGTSDASGYSMSSSSMFRNEGLTTIDEQFDQIQKEYESDDEDDDDSEANSDDAPELITSREDFEDIMSEFLDNYEVLGGKMRQKLAGGTGAEKLDTIRKALGRATLRDPEDETSEDDDILMPLERDDAKDRWDCETILTTYSNLENHPRLIRARLDRPVPKIRLDPKTGLPSVDTDTDDRRRTKNTLPRHEDTDNAFRSTRATIARPKDESKEDKKLRKQAVKADRQARRVDKKTTKEQFSNEIKQQTKSLVNKEKTKMKKL